MVSAGETCYVAIYEGEYIPVTEQRDARPVNTTLERGFQRLFVLDDEFGMAQIRPPP